MVCQLEAERVNCSSSAELSKTQGRPLSDNKTQLLTGRLVRISFGLGPAARMLGASPPLHLVRYETRGSSPELIWPLLA
jgi:hypothetical protein